MGTTTDYLETRLIDHASGQAAYTHPSQLYVGLILNSGLPQKDGTHTEVTGTSYSRNSVDFNAAAAGVDGATADNTALLSWTPSGENWGDVGAIGLYDAASGGNLLWFTNLTAVETINDGDTFELPAGIIDLKLGGTV